MFFKHINETFESFLPFLNYFITPIIVGTIVILWITSNQLPKIKIHSSILFVLFIISIYNSNINDVSFQLIKEIPKIVQHKQIDKKINSHIENSKETNQSIILIIGESIRAKEYLEKNATLFQNNSYKTIYSGATNTDVSVPMLLNGAKDPREINLENNLFSLAKKNNYTTYFISTQNKNYLKYIIKYLGKDIDVMNIIGSKDDFDLIKTVNKIDFSQKSFAVLQMQGAHSPYTFHNQTQSSDIKENYYSCIEKSFFVIESIISQYPNIKIYFTSDHGENLGENGRLGHNRFSPEVYRVPFFINQKDSNLSTINSHHDVYKTILNNLGFTIKEDNRINKIQVFGTMIDAQDGFVKFSK